MIDKIRKNKKHADLNAISDHTLRTDVSNLDQDFLELIISERTNQNQIENQRTPQGLDSFWRTLSISPEQEEVLYSPAHEKCIYISPQFMEIDSVSNKTIPEVATDSGTPEINEKRQIEKCCCKGTQTDFPEIFHSSSFVKIEEILPKVLRVEANLLALRSYIKYELSDMNRKMESLTNGISDGFRCQFCENLKENLSFLQKELLAKDEFMKSLLETQTAILNSLSNSKLMPGSLLSSCNCSIQNEEENMENKPDKGKHKIKQPKQKQEKNFSKLYIGNLNLGIKENDLVELLDETPLNT